MAGNQIVPVGIRRVRWQYKEGMVGKTDGNHGGDKGQEFQLGAARGQIGV